MLSRFLPRTLRARLTVLIVIPTSVVLALSGIALYEALRSRIDATASEQMESTMAALKAHLSDAQSTDEVARNAEVWIDQLHGHETMEMAIFDMAGNRLLSTSGFPLYPEARSLTASRPFSRCNNPEFAISSRSPASEAITSCAW